MSLMTLYKCFFFH